MAKNYQQLWNDVASAANEAKAIRILAKISADSEGRSFISRLHGRDAKICVEILAKVSHDLHLSYSLSQMIFQGILTHGLKPADKQAFFLTLRRLAEGRGRLPDRMRITETIEVSDELSDFGGFGDVRFGTYKGHPVAVKTLRVAPKDSFPKIRKVSIDVGRLGRGLNCSVPAILQGSRPVEHAVPSKHLETCWGSGPCEETAPRNRVGVDGPRKHHGVHQKQPR